MADTGGTPRPHVLDFEQLRTALDGVVDLAVERFGPRLDVEAVPGFNDHYWHLPVDTAHALDDDPGLHVDAGRSSDDLQELADMLAQPQDQVLWHSVKHLVGLLTLVSFLADPRPGRRRPPGAQPARSPGTRATGPAGSTS